MRFKINAADRSTGEELVFELDAPTVQEARTKANAAGYLINSITPSADTASSTTKPPANKTDSMHHAASHRAGYQCRSCKNMYGPEQGYDDGHGGFICEGCYDLEPAVLLANTLPSIHAVVTASTSKPSNPRKHSTTIGLIVLGVIIAIVGSTYLLVDHRNDVGKSQDSGLNNMSTAPEAVAEGPAQWQVSFMPDLTIRNDNESRGDMVFTCYGPSPTDIRRVHACYDLRRLRSVDPNALELRLQSNDVDVRWRDVTSTIDQEQRELIITMPCVVNSYVDPDPSVKFQGKSNYTERIYISDRPNPNEALNKTFATRFECDGSMEIETELSHTSKPLHFASFGMAQSLVGNWQPGYAFPNNVSLNTSGGTIPKSTDTGAARSNIWAHPRSEGTPTDTPTALAPDRPTESLYYTSGFKKGYSAVMAIKNLSEDNRNVALDRIIANDLVDARNTRDQYQEMHGSSSDESQHATGVFDGMKKGLSELGRIVVDSPVRSYATIRTNSSSVLATQSPTGNIVRANIEGGDLLAHVVTDIHNEKDAAAIIRGVFQDFPGNVLKAESVGETHVIKNGESATTIGVTVRFSIDQDKYATWINRVQPILLKLATKSDVLRWDPANLPRWGVNHEQGPLRPLVANKSDEKLAELAILPSARQRLSLDEWGDVSIEKAQWTAALTGNGLIQWLPKSAKSDAMLVVVDRAKVGKATLYWIREELREELCKACSIVPVVEVAINDVGGSQIARTIEPACFGGRSMNSAFCASPFWFATYVGGVNSDGAYNIQPTAVLFSQYMGRSGHLDMDQHGYVDVVARWDGRDSAKVLVLPMLGAAHNGSITFIMCPSFCKEFSFDIATDRLKDMKSVTVSISNHK